MNRHLSAAVPAALLAVGALTLTGCAGASDASTRYVSPIDEYMSAAAGTDLDEHARDAEGDARLLENEELIASCMQEAGFEYVPHPPTPIGFDFSTLDSPELDDRTWVERNGYGIVQRVVSDGTTVSKDPNLAIADALSPAERTAYDTALTGGSAAYDADGDYVPEQAGCMGAAQLELDSRDPLKSAEFTPLIDAVMDFYAALPTQPEIVELDGQWAECMSAAGFGPYATPLDPIGEVNAEISMLVQEAAGAEPDAGAVEELAAREIELALADLTCREETGYREQQRSVRTTLEERFVEDHLAELQAYKAAAEAGA
ncbi:hypothetical protein ACDF64_13985 [Agromyces sp. MMS24-JH15]|uniref:hypothetical protein n=1 Tax=Agromyces sp. MMS24-JH15 TaxID=3243765 RepID=UPI0037487263